MTTWLLVTVLQFQCGAQLVGESSLSYGTLVYSTLQSPSPSVGFFHRQETSFKKHDFCPLLEQAVESGRSVWVEVDAQNNRIYDVQ